MYCVLLYCALLCVCHKEDTLKEKRVLKQCSWDIILENGAFFNKVYPFIPKKHLQSKNGTKTVPKRVQRITVPVPLNFLSV